MKFYQNLDYQDVMCDNSNNMNKLDKHKAAVKDFIETKGFEPTALDFDSSNLLPTARTIQRTYGGLRQFRLLAGLKTVDFTTGQARTKKAKKAMKLSGEMETVIFQRLLDNLGSKRVSSPARVFLNNGKTVDFKIELNDKILLVDVFYPTTKPSFIGCVNIKNKKYSSKEESFYQYPYEIILVCLNKEVMVNTNSKLRVLNEDEFNKLCVLK